MPQRTSAYVDQRDVHIAELSVRDLKHHPALPLLLLRHLPVFLSATDAETPRVMVSAETIVFTQVRETMDFAARVQGVGNKAAELQTLLEREIELGADPDPEIDAFMKASATVC